MSYYPDFAELIDQSLTRLDRPGAWLAERLGVNPTTVSRWRSGQARPGSPELVERIADCLGIHGEERTRLFQSVGYAFIEADEEEVVPFAQSLSILLDYPETYRQTEVQTLARWIDIGASGIVCGLAGCGASTILRFVTSRPDLVARHLIDKRPGVFVWLELQPMVAPVAATIYRQALRGILEMALHFSGLLPTELREACERYRNETDLVLLQTTLFNLLAHCQSQQIRIVFVAPRIDQLPPDLQLDVGNTLRSLRDRFRDTVLYLMGMRVTPTYLDRLYAFGELGRLLSTYSCVVGRLTETDSRFVIAQRAGRVHVTPTETEITQFLALSGGYPTLLKATIQWWLFQQAPPPHATWQATLLQEAGIQLRLRELWECLSEEEQAVMQSILTRQNVDMIPSDIGTLLAQLGLCHQTGDRWQLAGTLFAGLG